MTEQFRNPYTFIPAFPRDPQEDGPPPRRDRLHPERWTGRIGVRLIVETPLLLLDTPRARPTDSGEPEHLRYPVLLRDGRPHLPATSVKGMLRTAYEAITNSRFGVFRGHDTPLGFRRPTEDALKMEPVMVGNNRKLHLFEQAKLPFYKTKQSDNIRYDDGTKPKHLDRVAAVVERGTVRRLVRRDQKAQLDAETDKKVVTGVVYITGRNIDGKRYERLFYDADYGAEQLEEDEWLRLADAWNDLIRAYQVAHEDELKNRRHPDGRPAKPWEWIGKEPGNTAWSPHVYAPLKEYVPLRPGMFCWALRRNGRIIGLYPVMVTRDIWPISPADLLSESLKPAPSFAKLSPAEKLFGWVANGASGVRPAALRGRLRIGPITCAEDAVDAVRYFDGDGLPLAILGQPKPTQARFYLAESQDRPDRPMPDRTPRDKLYQRGRALRGRKAYWHHAGLGREHWDEPASARDATQTPVDGRYREFRRPHEPELDSKNKSIVDGGSFKTTKAEQRDKQNRSIGGWIKPGTEFTFTIDVRDLDEGELGALTWLLSLPSNHFHRLGLGKPLGFGSVRIEIDWNETELSSGDQWINHYRSLTAPLATCDAKQITRKAMATYAKLMDDSPKLRAIRDAFLAVAKGDPNARIHYPRTRPKEMAGNAPTPPDPTGSAYEWFTKNEQLKEKDRGHSLPSAVSAAGLPVYPRDEDKPNANKKDRR